MLRPTRFLEAALGTGGGWAGLCDGHRSIEGIAQVGGIDVQIAQEALTGLYAAGLVVEVDAGPVPPLLFLEHARRLADLWRNRAQAEQPALAAAFAGGGYSRRLATGFLLEASHFIRSAPAHISAAIAHCPDEDARLVLSAYLAEEYWHGTWMKESLCEAGLTTEDIERAVPLPATQAVIHGWNHAAHTDALLYAGLIAITEGQASAEHDPKALFARTVAQGVLSEAAWRPYFEHLACDEAADHLRCSRALYARADGLGRPRRDALRRGLVTHVELVLAMERSILEFYGDRTGPSVYSIEP